MTTAEKEKSAAHRSSGSRMPLSAKKSHPTSVKVALQPTPKLTAAMNGPYVGPFKTKKELFDALEAKEEG